jgi:hypothetical protein
MRAFSYVWQKYLYSTSLTTWTTEVSVRKYEAAFRAIPFESLKNLTDRRKAWLAVANLFVTIEMSDLLEVINFYLENPNPLARKKLEMFLSK